MNSKILFALKLGIGMAGFSFLMKIVFFTSWIKLITLPLIFFLSWFFLGFILMTVLKTYCFEIYSLLIGKNDDEEIEEKPNENVDLEDRLKFSDTMNMTDFQIDNDSTSPQEEDKSEKESISYDDLIIEKPSDLNENDQVDTLLKKDKTILDKNDFKHDPKNLARAVSSMLKKD